MKPFLFSQSFVPDKKPGNKDLNYFRRRALDESNTNIQFLLEMRYNWMRDYLSEGMKGVELGAGIGLSKNYLSEFDYELTDCYRHKWLDKVVDAMNLPYENESIDFLILSNVIHHVSQPLVFLKEAQRILKKGGKIIMIDVKCSLAVRLLFRLLDHEGYSYDVDVFDTSIRVNDPDQPWLANNAVCDLLFENKDLFEKKTGFKILLDKPIEFFVFLFSGGISNEFPTIRLNRFFLTLLSRLDSFLSLLPAIFPLSRKTILIKE